MQALQFHHKLALLEGGAAVDAPKTSPLAQAAGSLLPFRRCNVTSAAEFMVDLQVQKAMVFVTFSGSTRVF